MFMVRGNIRDNRSSREIKPRIMDYIKNDQGEELLEVKDGKLRRTILLTDLEQQIAKLREEHK